MNWYQLTSCNGLLVIWVSTDLGALGITVNHFFQTVEYPGECFRITDIVDVDPGGSVTVTQIGPLFLDCQDCVDGILQGCTDPTACNYDPCATIDDGSCFYNNATIRILCNDEIEDCFDCNE